MRQLTPVHTRICQDLYRRLKMHCAERGLTTQVVIGQSIVMYLDKYDKLVEKMKGK